MYLLLGDSNLRQTMEAYKDDIEEKVGVEITFEQITTNEALKVALETIRDPKPDLIYFSTILNEIAATVGRGKPIETVIKAVTIEQNDIINKHANNMNNSSNLFLLANPYLRQDPKWIEEKITMIKFYMTEHVRLYSPSNVVNVIEPTIVAEDLEADKVHLTLEARKKVAEKLVIDLNIGKEELEIFKEEGMDWEGMVRFSQKKPKAAKSLKKRPRQADDIPDSEQKKQKDEGEESVMSILKGFMTEIREDRLQTSLQSRAMAGEVEAIKEVQVEIQQQVSRLEQRAEVNSLFTATVREDLDAVDNENLRNTVIVKKLTSTKRIPNDRTELSKLVQKAAKKWVKEILGEDTSIAYVSLLYTGKEGIKNTEGQLPSFKIVFKTKQAGIDFKDRAVQLSKQEEHALNGAYFSTQQTLATRIRSTLMWGIADKIKNPAKGIDAWVSQNFNKPMLQVKGLEKFQRGYTFVTAMVKYGEKLDDKTKEDAQKLARKAFAGQVEKIFYILKD